MVDPTSAALSVLDIGTSSVRVLGVTAADGSVGLRRLLDQGLITRLGKDRGPDGRLHPESVERTRLAVVELREVARARNAPVRAAVGTSALRDAPGASAVRGLLEEAAGCRVEIISGTREAELVVKGVKTRHRLDGPFALLDVGGGSTEIVRGHHDAIESLVSLDLGAGRLLQEASSEGATSTGELFDLAEERFRKVAAGSDWSRAVPGTAFYGLGGTVTTLAAVALRLDPFDPERIEGNVLACGELRELTRRIGGLSPTERAALPGMEPGREELVVPGAAVVLAVVRGLRGSSVIVTNHGIRWGLAAEVLCGL